MIKNTKGSCCPHMLCRPKRGTRRQHDRIMQQMEHKEMLLLLKLRGLVAIASILFQHQNVSGPDSFFKLFFSAHVLCFKNELNLESKIGHVHGFKKDFIRDDEEIEATTWCLFVYMCSYAPPSKSGRRLSWFVCDVMDVYM